MKDNGVKQAVWKGTKSVGNYPKGCSRCSNGHMFLNTRNGSNNKHSFHICGKVNFNPEAIMGTEKFMKGAFDGIKDFGQDFKESLQELGEDRLDDVKDVVQNVGKGIMSFFGNLFGRRVVSGRCVSKAGGPNQFSLGAAAFCPIPQNQNELVASTTRRFVIGQANTVLPRSRAVANQELLQWVMQNEEMQSVKPCVSVGSN